MGALRTESMVEAPKTAESPPQRPVRRLAPRRRRRMVPREHGAYAELLFPIAAVFLGGSPTPSAWLIAIAVVACFVMNEPLLVLFGQRGSRALREDRDYARRALLLYVLVAVVSGGSGLALATTAVQMSATLLVVLGVGVILLAVEGLERTAFGETLAAAALSSTAVPLGLASGLSAGLACAVGAIWMLVSLLATWVVRLTVARARAKAGLVPPALRTRRVLLIAASLSVVALGAAAPLSPRGPLWVLSGAIPVAGTVAVLAWARPSVRRLRSVGWGLVAANCITLIGVVTAVRLVRDFDAIRSTLPFPMF